MTKKLGARNAHIARLMHELSTLSEQMACAMMQADIQYVAAWQMTPRMRDLMERYYYWAKKANEAGL